MFAHKNNLILFLILLLIWWNVNLLMTISDVDIEYSLCIFFLEKYLFHIKVLFEKLMRPHLVTFHQIKNRN